MKKNELFRWHPANLKVRMFVNMPEMAPDRGKIHRYFPLVSRVRLPPAPAFAGASPGGLGAIVSTRQMRDPSLFRAAGGRIFAIWGRFGHAFAARVRVVLVDLYRMTYLCVIQMPIALIYLNISRK